MGHGTKFKTLTVDGLAVDVHVSDNGQFTAEVLGTDLFAGALPTLEKQVREHVRRNRAVSLPITKHDGDELEDCEIVGVHGGNGNLLIRHGGPKGTVHQDRGWGNREFLRRLTKVECKEFQKLSEAITLAEQQREAWLDARAINPKTELEKIMPAAAKETKK